MTLLKLEQLFLLLIILFFSNYAVTASKKDYYFTCSVNNSPEPLATVCFQNGDFVRVTVSSRMCKHLSPCFNPKTADRSTLPGLIAAIALLHEASIQAENAHATLELKLGKKEQKSHSVYKDNYFQPYQYSWIVDILSEAALKFDLISEANHQEKIDTQIFGGFENWIMFNTPLVNDDNTININDGRYYDAFQFCLNDRVRKITQAEWRYDREDGSYICHEAHSERDISVCGGPEDVRNGWKFFWLPEDRESGKPFMFSFTASTGSKETLVFTSCDQEKYRRVVNTLTTQEDGSSYEDQLTKITDHNKLILKKWKDIKNATEREQFERVKNDLDELRRSLTEHQYGLFLKNYGVMLINIAACFPESENKQIYGAHELMTDLLDNGSTLEATMNSEEMYCWTTDPLTTAVINKRRGTLKFLLERGARPHSNQVYMTALGYAVENKDVDSAKLLLDNGADVNIGGDDTPLTMAARQEDCGMVDLLLQHGANPNITGDKRGFVHGGPLYYAVVRNNLGMLNKFIQAGATDNIGYAETCGALQLAAKLGNIKFIEVLLDAPGVTIINICKEEHDMVTTPLALAARSGQNEAVTLLLNKGALVDGGIIFEAARGGSVEILQKLLLSCSDVNFQTQVGETPISIAAEKKPCNRIHIIGMLLKQGAHLRTPCDPQVCFDYEVLDENNASLILDRSGNCWKHKPRKTLPGKPYIISLLKNTNDSLLVHFLLSKLENKDEKRLHLMHLVLKAAGDKNGTMLLKELLNRYKEECNANFSVVLHGQRISPLAEAVSAGLHKNAIILLEHGADPNGGITVDQRNLSTCPITPYQRAYKNNDQEMLCILRRENADIQLNMSNQSNEKSCHVYVSYSNSGLHDNYNYPIMEW
ncbi:hypothetical protein CI610_03228 [invertebrate metagenome]|uniref:Uncharacterized protein n=1 Tax=invertebrate metagenome TaxID=1711999 RepID=A0A2H9T3P7_9ZZZZ